MRCAVRSALLAATLLTSACAKQSPSTGPSSRSVIPAEGLVLLDDIERAFSAFTSLAKDDPIACRVFAFTDAAITEITAVGKLLQTAPLGLPEMAVSADHCPAMTQSLTAVLAEAAAAEIANQVEIAQVAVNVIADLTPGDPAVLAWVKLAVGRLAGLAQAIVEELSAPDQTFTLPAVPLD